MRIQSLGPRVHLSLVQGFAFAERIDWNNINEGTGLIGAIENYRRRYGFFPELVHADRIYRTRANPAYCSAHGIRLSGPPLGRPPKAADAAREQKKLARRDEIDRIPIEGKFGQGKRRFGLARIMAKLSAASMTVIGLNLLVMNLNEIFCVRDWKGFFLSLHRWIGRALEAFPTGQWRIGRHDLFPAGCGGWHALFFCRPYRRGQAQLAGLHA